MAQDYTVHDAVHHVQGGHSQGSADSHQQKQSANNAQDPVQSRNPGGFGRKPQISRARKAFNEFMQHKKDVAGIVGSQMWNNGVGAAESNAWGQTQLYVEAGGEWLLRSEVVAGLEIGQPQPGFLSTLFGKHSKAGNAVPASSDSDKDNMLGAKLAGLSIGGDKGGFLTRLKSAVVRSILEEPLVMQVVRNDNNIVPKELDITANTTQAGGRSGRFPALAVVDAGDTPYGHVTIRKRRIVAQGAPIRVGIDWPNMFNAASLIGIMPKVTGRLTGNSLALLGGGAFTRTRSLGPGEKYRIDPDLAMAWSTKPPKIVFASPSLLINLQTAWKKLHGDKLVKFFAVEFEGPERDKNLPDEKQPRAVVVRLRDPDTFTFKQ